MCGCVDEGSTDGIKKCARRVTFAALPEPQTTKNVNKSVSPPCSATDAAALWPTIDQRTPLMLAAACGCVELVKLLLSSDKTGDVNFSCSFDKRTALHYAASSGSIQAVEVVKLLLDAGANPSSADALGLRPVDVIVPAPGCPGLRDSLSSLLQTRVVDDPQGPMPRQLHIPQALSDLYASDEFRMYMFKIHPCLLNFLHDLSDCPFVHPGETWRRRDPMNVPYTCIPCPEFRKGKCKSGDSCHNAHGVYESGLHPAQYRTRPCKDGAGCSRKLCFFAHSPGQVRFPQSVANLNSLLGAQTPMPLSGMLFPGFHPQTCPGNTSINPEMLFPGIQSQTGPGIDTNVLLQYQLQQMYLLNLTNQAQLAGCHPLLLLNQLGALPFLSPQNESVNFPNNVQQQHNNSVNFLNNFPLQQISSQVEAILNPNFLISYTQGKEILGSRTAGNSSFFSWDLPKKKDDREGGCVSGTGDRLSGLNIGSESRKCTAEEPDFSWVQSLLTDSKPAGKDDYSALETWLDNMQLLDQPPKKQS